VYQRFQLYLRTTNNTVPTTNNLYVTYDSTYKVMNMTVADGSGLDAAQGLGLEYLSDTYSWGNVLSDYTIVFPYAATVTTSYWNGSAWVVWDTHTNISGSIKSPPRVTRDGTQGPGVESTNLSGQATNMASGATLWKWEGTAPFYLAINDVADDEFSVLGWNTVTNTFPIISTNIIDISGRNNNATPTNGVSYSNNNRGSFVFDGDDDYISLGKSFISTGEIGTGDISYTLEAWIYISSLPSTDLENGFSIIGNAGLEGIGMQLFDSSGIKVNFGYRSTNNFNSTSSLNFNTWYHIVCTRQVGVSNRIYINGTLDATFDSTQLSVLNTTAEMQIGWANGRVGRFNGRISNIKLYNTFLTDQQVRQNFNALRGRFSI
jgi:hypothetical protein